MEKKHALNVVPWLAHGHVSPYLELAKRLSTRNFHIYICSTPINLAPIKKRVTTHKYSHSIQLIELHIPSQPDLPSDFHTTNGLPPHLNSTLKRAMHMASPSAIEIIRTLQPDIIIHDFNQQWAKIAASSLAIPAVQFLTVSAFSVCYCAHKLSKQDVDFPYPDLVLQGPHWDRKSRDMLDQLRKDDQEQERSGNTAAVRRTCDIVLMKTSGEMEEKYIKYGSELLGKKIVLTGPLAQDLEETDDNSEIMEWHNKKETASTILVSFGTEYFLTREEREEIAKGLELSMVNFIWVLRFSFEEKISVEEALPNASSRG